MPAAGSEELQLAKAGQLPQLVSQRLQELRATEERLQSRRHERASRVSARHKVYTDSIGCGVCCSPNSLPTGTD